MAQIINHPPLDTRDNLSYKIIVTRGRFRRLRESMDYSQAQLGKQMGVAGRSVRRWEAGRMQIPKVAGMALEFIVLKAKMKGKR